MRRTLLLFIALLFVATAVRAFTIDNLSYVANYGTNVSVSAAGRNISGDIAIPSTVTYGDVTYTVTRINNYAFANCSSLTSVKIPNSVTNIGESAFQGCSSLAFITIPDGMTSIGPMAFTDCSSLTSVIIPNNVTSIGSAAFSGCSSLTSVTISNCVTNIGRYAFQRCSSLNSVTIPNSVINIDEGAFYGCSSLTSVTIPNSVTSIGNYAFENCSSLTSITIPNSVTSIGGNAFNGCIALRTVEAKMTQPSTISSSYVFRSVDLSKVKLIIPGGTQSAYQSAGWTGFGVIEIDPNTPTRFVVNASGVLTQYVGLGGNVVIPNEVKSIASTAFSNNTTITSIVIPESVTTINNGAFTGCSSLTSISIPNSVTSIGSSAFYGCNRLASVTIPNSVTSIGDGVFYGCSRLVSVTISEKVTAIGNNAFAGCTALRTVEAKMTRPPNISFNTFQSVDLSKVKLIIPGGTVGVYQSAGWTGFGAIEMAGTPVHFVINTSGELTRYIGPGGDIVIPDEVKSIGNGVFKNNTGITSVVIPEGVTAIGNEAFAGCTALRTVEAKMTQPPRISSSYIFQSVDLSKVKLIVPGGMVTAYQSAGWTGFGTVEMNPNTPTRFIIDESGRLTQYIGPGGNIVIPGEVKTIAASAFQNNTTITSVVIPESVTTIYDGAFAGCSSLTSITIPNSVTSISNNAFQNCSSLTSATIPNSVTYINSQAFSGCSSLTSVTIPNSVTYINSQAFSGCSSLTSVTIPNSVTSISNNAFQNCSSLTSITIPNSVTSLGHAVFAGCSSLAYIIIPNSVTGIGSNAFADCSRLSSVTIANGVTSIGDYAFMNCTGLKVFEVKWFEPLTVSATLFNGVDLSAIKLVVPVGARSNYRQANVWSNFGSIEEYRAGINPIPNIPTPDDPAPGPDPGDGRDFVIDAAGVLTKYTGAGGAVEIPSGVKSIGIRAFENCRTLVSVAIPESVASIGALAFAGCTALKSVSTAWDTPVGITALAFSGVNLSGVTLRVPAGREAAYRSAAVWRTFGSIAAGNDLTEAPATDVYYAAGVLTVDSPVAEQVSVYSAAGVRQFRAVKPAGRAAFAVPRFPRGVWIAAGSSGWTVKFVSIEN